MAVAPLLGLPRRDFEGSERSSEGQGWLDHSTYEIIG